MGGKSSAKWSVQFVGMNFRTNTF
ncbi:DUF6783 domain-containing protein [Blautia producta]